MKYSIVEYVNKNGKIALKVFLQKEEMDKFVNNLVAKNIQHLVVVG